MKLIRLSGVITFLNCEKPVNIKTSPLYIPSTPCFGRGTFWSNGDLYGPNKGQYSYVLTRGTTNASELKDSCRIELMVMTSGIFR